MILNCNCTAGPTGNKMAATQQDALYGLGNRVHNPLVKADMFRCTICLRERAKGNKTEEKPDKKLAKTKS